MLVVGTLRPIDAAERPDVLEALLRLEQDGVARRRPVVPLGGEGVRALAAGMLGEPPPDALVGWLLDRTRGNPLEALGLLGALVEDGADLRHPALRRLPEALADRIALRLAAVDVRAVEVVELLAVIGRRAELRTLVALSGREPEELADALDRLRRARLVDDDDGVVVEITHPLVADAVYERIGGTRRRLLHRAAGRVLRTLGRGGEAAAHFARCAAPGAGEAVTALRDAVAAAEAAGAFAEALALLDALVRLLPHGDPRWLDVVDALAWDAQWVVDHRADAHAALGVPALRAMDAALADLDDLGRRAAVKLRLAIFIGWGSGTLAEAEDICREAVALYVAAGDRRGELLAAHELAWVRGLADVAVLEAGATAVADAAAREGDAVVRSRAVRSLWMAAIWRGRPTDAAMAEVRATTGGDRHRERLANAGSTLPAALAGRVAEGRAVLDRLPAADRRALADYEALFHWWAGDLAAVRGLTGTVSGIGPAPACRRLGLGLFAASLAAAEVGATAEAERYAATHRGLYAGSGWVLHAATADHVEAVLRWRDGRAEEALDLLRRAVSVLARGDMVVQALPAGVDLTEIAGRAGVAEPSVVAELDRIATRTGVPAHRGIADLAAAWSAAAAGDTGTACAAAEAALPALADLELLRGRALFLLGRTSADREHAVTALTDAAAVFAACGATLRRAEALDALASLGSRGRRAAAAEQGPASLTAREREVAELAAGGLSAREIAAALFIGERTVESHLARAYARLGVRSKVELAARAGELDLEIRTAVRTGTAAARPAGS
ncbi:MAG: LuxR C-terminal-related transcriptional regulator [Pseudonocardia sp.]